ncbi:MAG: DUF892 family protein, partial [Steroidobacteraceae bacterium]
KNEVLPNTTSILNAIRVQWQRLRQGFNGNSKRESMQDMYVSELGELHSAAAQFSVLADEMWIAMGNEALARRVSGYAADLRVRVAQLQMLGAQDPSGRDQTDEAMQALALKASRAAERYGDTVRDAALAGALQAIMHYMIAEYGTLAAHARVLGRHDDAERFTGYASEDKALDAEISDLAVRTLNVDAASNTPK